MEIVMLSDRPILPIYTFLKDIPHTFYIRHAYLYIRHIGLNPSKKYTFHRYMLPIYALAYVKIGEPQCLHWWREVHCCLPYLNNSMKTTLLHVFTFKHSTGTSNLCSRLVVGYLQYWPWWPEVHCSLRPRWEAPRSGRANRSGEIRRSPGVNTIKHF